MKQREIIPIFFACDDNYISVLSVALISLMKNASKKYDYRLYVLNTGITESKKDLIISEIKAPFTLEFVDVTSSLNQLKNSLYTRDYYTNTTYYRFFIDSLFPQYDKAIYLDSDIVVKGDISKMFHYQLGSKLLGAVKEEVMALSPSLSAYPSTVLGVERRHYFNAGILLMNLAEIRKKHVYQQFVSLLMERRFPLAQDQDYLNYLANGKVRYLPLGWNKTPIKARGFQKKSLQLAHFKIAWKPWHQTGIMFGDIFWHYAKMSPFYNELLEMRANYSEEKLLNDWKAYAGLSVIAQQENEKALNERRYENNETIVLAGTSSY